MAPLRVLILGGSAEASALARLLADDDRFAPVLSLAGRTKAPVLPPIPHRIGGFGGVESLARWLGDPGADLLVCATHPFAAQMRRNAVEAARRTGTPMLIVERPAWSPVEGDSWTGVADMAQAAQALGQAPRRVLLTVGRKDLAPFVEAPQHDYLIRSIDAPPAEGLPPRAQVITARPPFGEACERRLLEARRIEVVVTKNSGGGDTAAKLAAARALSLPVILVERPLAPDLSGLDVQHAVDGPEALAWLEARHEAASRLLRV
ncbi:cobalt-precorrin-6A reductase [Phenylobacterium sp. LjRoot225]|uniref:cobalt-precorrin-6A reductase n=1 Tax=Phenylobacterium sp. LjRoot225 TaxID=3342285 RepID=UPI003ECF7D38